MSFLSRGAKILRTEGLRGLINAFRRFLYFRMPNRRLALQLYYLAKGKSYAGLKMDSVFMISGVGTGSTFLNYSLMPSIPTGI